MSKHILIPTEGSKPSDRAAAAGIPFEGVSVTVDCSTDVIAQAARQRRCDQIVMASHGRRAAGQHGAQSAHAVEGTDAGTPLSWTT